MRQHGIAGGARQPRIDADIDRAHHGRDIGLALGEPMQDRGFARLAMPRQEAHIARAIRNFRAVAGEIQILVALRQRVERGHVVDHRSVRRRHDRGRPAHDVVADETDLSLRPGERQMIGGVARRRHRFQRPAGAFDGVAMLHFDVRPEVAVGAGFRIVLLALEARPRGAMRALGINRGAGGGLDPRGVRRMIAVGVGDEDMRHGLAAHRVEQRRRMGLIIRAGIDDRDLAGADDVTDRAGEGERARIVAEHAPHAGADLLDHAGLQGKVAVERDVVGVGHGDCLCVAPRHSADGLMRGGPQSRLEASGKMPCRAGTSFEVRRLRRRGLLGMRSECVEAYENA